MATEEEFRVMRYSMHIAELALRSHLSGDGALDSSYSYNHFISDMSDHGVPSEFANRVLDEMRYSVGPNAALIVG